MARGRRCARIHPRWLEVLGQGGDTQTGFVSFRIHGWRGVLLTLMRPVPSLRTQLYNHWVGRFLPSPPRGTDDGPGQAGIREPRRPSPLAGAGAVALAEPDGVA
jgi:hypothetical protein